MKNGFFMATGVLLVAGTIGLGQTLPTAPPKASGAPALLASVPQDPIIVYPSIEPPGTRFWVSADYLLWWLRKGPVNGPLVTSGSVNDAIPGALGQPRTQVLFGNNDLNYNPFSGMRFQAGIQLDSGLSLEGGFFLFETRTVSFNAASDANGNPLIARPIFNNRANLEEAYGTSFPGAWFGQTGVSSHSALQGYEINLAANLRDTACSQFQFLVGFRALNLNEDLAIQDRLAPLKPGILTFLGKAVNAPNSLADFDRFHAGNQFYGGQLGGRWETFFDRFSLAVTGKVAFGATQELVTIDGSSTQLTPAGSTTVPGGILAQTSNMGRHYRDVFAVVPEANVNLNWQLTPRLSASTGYSFLYWSSVARPGSQIDHGVNPSLPPTDQSFGTTGAGQNRPGFQFQSSSFWAQGVNFGLMFRF